jgi:hypothetical protein
MTTQRAKTPQDEFTLLHGAETRKRGCNPLQCAAAVKIFNALTLI